MSVVRADSVCLGDTAPCLGLRAGDQRSRVPFLPGVLIGLYRYVSPSPLFFSVADVDYYQSGIVAHGRD